MGQMIIKFFKGILAGLIILFLAFLAWQGNFSFNFGQTKTLTVTGTGRVIMKPEVGRFTAGVQKYGNTVTEAMDQERQATAAILSALKDSGVKEEDIKTNYFSVWPQLSDYYEDTVRKQKITGYSVSNSVEVKVREVERVSDILGKAIAAGANNISGLSFGADEPKEEEAQAREKAIADAQEKAVKMAKAAGRRLGKIVSVTEGYLPYAPVSYGAGGGGGGPSIESGGVEVTQTVTVVFELR